jgi:hypothetical protein
MWSRALARSGSNLSSLWYRTHVRAKLQIKMCYCNKLWSDWLWCKMQWCEDVKYEIGSRCETENRLKITYTVLDWRYAHLRFWRLIHVARFWRVEFKFITNWWLIHLMTRIRYVPTSGSLYGHLQSTCMKHSTDISSQFHRVLSPFIFWF